MEDSSIFEATLSDGCLLHNKDLHSFMQFRRSLKHVDVVHHGTFPKTFLFLPSSCLSSLFYDDVRLSNCLSSVTGHFRWPFFLFHSSCFLGLRLRGRILWYSPQSLYKLTAVPRKSKAVCLPLARVRYSFVDRCFLAAFSPIGTVIVLKTSHFVNYVEPC